MCQIQKTNYDTSFDISKKKKKVRTGRNASVEIWALLIMEILEICI